MRTLHREDIQIGQAASANSSDCPNESLGEYAELSGNQASMRVLLWQLSLLFSCSEQQMRKEWLDYEEDYGSIWLVDAEDDWCKFLIMKLLELTFLVPGIGLTVHTANEEEVKECDHSDEDDEDYDDAAADYRADSIKDAECRKVILVSLSDEDDEVIGQQVADEMHKRKTMCQIFNIAGKEDIENEYEHLDSCGKAEDECKNLTMRMATAEAGCTWCERGICWAHGQVSRPAQQTITFKTGDWMCPGCGDHQFASRKVCRKCGATPVPPWEKEAVPPWVPDHGGGRQSRAETPVRKVRQIKLEHSTEQLTPKKQTPPWQEKRVVAEPAPQKSTPPWKGTRAAAEELGKPVQKTRPTWKGSLGAAEALEKLEPKSSRGLALPRQTSTKTRWVDLKDVENESQELRATEVRKQAVQQHKERQKLKAQEAETETRKASAKKQRRR